nr:hypothetical protein [Tanacetum cinerariifolium]
MKQLFSTLLYLCHLELQSRRSLTTKKVVEHEDEMVLAAKRKAQAAKSKAANKRPGPEGPSRRTKRKKIDPTLMALDKSEQEDSSQSGSETHHYASPLTTVISDNVNVGTGASNQALQDVEKEEEKTRNDSNLTTNDVNEEGEINSPHLTFSPYFVHSMHSKCSLHFEDQHNVLSSDYDLHRSGNDNIQNAITGSTDASGGGSFLGHTSPMEKMNANNLRGSLERFTTDLTQMKIARHNYVTHLLPTVVQRLLSSHEFKKGLSDVFNQAIVAGWSEGVQVGRTVQNGPLVWPTVEGDDTTRTKRYEELSVAEKLQADYDLKATNIGRQGLPPDVYAIVNHHKVEIWDRVKLLMQGTKLSLQEKECKLYDEFDKFSFVKGETMYQYYWIFTQLINDVNVINMSMRPVQVNTKFLNSLPPEWSKFVTDMKLARDLHTTNYDQLYSYLEQNEAHANEIRLMRE